MNKVFFPNVSKEQQTFLDREELRRFRQESKALEDRADRIANDFRHIPKDDVTTLAKDTYTLAVRLFEMKMARGITLLAEEQAVYQLCKSEIHKYPHRPAKPAVQQVILSANPMCKAHSNAVALIRNCLEEIRLWFGLSSETEEADRYIVNAGDAILPHYSGLIRGFFTSISELFVPFLTASAFDMLEAQAECALFYQVRHKTVDKQLASEMLIAAGYARQGQPEFLQKGFGQLSEAEIPGKLKVLYDEASGLLIGSRGLKVWLGKKENCIIVSFSGTDFKNPNMVYADIVQLSEPSILYLKAAGLLRLLLEHIPDKPFYVTGHSLGGGLAEFSLTANMYLYADRLTGYGYNPAGLSMVSLRHLEAARLKAAAQNMWIFMTCHDMVSAIGGKIGCLTTLPETNQNGHGMEDLTECMEQYLHTPEM